MRILLYDNYDSFTYNLGHYIHTRTGSKAHVIRNDEHEPIEWDEYDGMIISPGPGLPSESGNLMNVILDLPQGFPVLGVCLGMQAMITGHNGTLKLMDQVKHGKSSMIRITVQDSRLFLGFDSSFKAGRYHSWVSDPKELPGVYRVTALDEQGDIMAIEHRSNPWFGIQFHPESIMTPDGGKLIGNWLDVVRHCNDRKAD